MLRVLDAGESHGKALVAIIEGFPAGLKIDIDYINRNLQLRQSGYGRGGRQKIEKDRVEILTGVRFSETLGSPITMLIKNRDFVNWKDIMSVDGDKTAQKRVSSPRPGHADLAGYIKYDRSDMRDVLERSSARQTAIRVAVGSLCEYALRELGVRIVSYVRSIGTVKANRIPSNWDDLESKILSSPVFCPDEDATYSMIAEIEKAKLAGDSLGGCVEVKAKGVVVGIGTYVSWDRRLDARLAMALMSIQAVKAVEIGDGFENAYRRGTEVHDEIFYDESGYFRKTNRAGGIEGGMSNGEDIIARAYMKPIPTLVAGLSSVDIDSKKPKRAAFERSDVCATPALSVVAKAAVAYELFNGYLEKFGSDTFEELSDRVKRYKEYVKTK